MALTSDENPVPAVSQRRYVPLLYRVAGLNAALLALAVGVTVAVLDPTRVSSFRWDEAGVLLVIVLVVAVFLNVYLVRRVVAPLQKLTALARRVDLTGDPERMPAPAAWSEAGELTLTFNEMLDRLQAERRDATGRVLAGQEAERLRIAQELHDQIGQQLTAVLLALARVESRAPATLKGDVIAVQEAVRSSLEDVRQIAIELRPEALDDLGLDSALAVLCERFTERTGLRISERVDPILPTISPEIELVLYRVAQEALTNVARHSGADAAQLELAYHDGLLTLTVRDSGRGLPPSYTPGTGMRGMRERAALIGAHLTIEQEPRTGGCCVMLTVEPKGEG
jgi:two-component system, NarL family, sensor histidine kinase UhpB